MAQVIILIPPSEGKKSGGTHAPLKKVSKDVHAVIDQWAGISAAEWGKLLGVKDKALARALEVNRALLTSKTLPAIERYTGVVYSAIDYASLKELARKYFDEHVRIVSAVFGLVKPRDVIPDYKCKINHFGADKHWRKVCKSTFSGAFVIDLLPQAHQKAVDYADGVAVGFSWIKGGRKMPAGHQGKHIKGRFIRWLCEQQCADPRLFKNFSEEGYRWNGKEFVNKGEL